MGKAKCGELRAWALAGRHPKSPRPTSLALGSENGSEKGAQAAGTESLTGGVWAGSGVVVFKLALRL